MVCSKCKGRIWYDGIMVNQLGDRVTNHGGGVIVSVASNGDRSWAGVRLDDGTVKEIDKKKLQPDMAWLETLWCRCGR